MTKTCQYYDIKIYRSVIFDKMIEQYDKQVKQTNPIKYTQGKKTFAMVNKGKKPTIKSSNESSFKGRCVQMQIKDDHLDQYPFSTIGKIMGRRNGQVLYGTGFLIDQSVVLTCAHNIYYHKSNQVQEDMQLKAEQIKFLLYDRKEKSLKEHSVKQVYFPEQFKTKDELKSMEYDFGALLLTESLEQRKGFLGTQFSFIESLTRKENLVVLGFQGKQPFIRQSSNNEKTKFEVSSGFISHQLSTEQGSSGGPLFIQSPNGQTNSYYAIGIHIKGKGNPHISQYNVAKYLDYRVFHKINQWLYSENNLIIQKENFNGRGLNEQQLQAHLVQYLDPNKYLYELQARDNKVSKLPSILFKQENYLRKLILESNNLNQISDIGQFKYLSFLNVSNNHIQEIPETIRALVELKVFLIANNQLKNLPLTLRQLNIEQFDLSENNLFPQDEMSEINVDVQWECIEGMSSLKKLALRGLHLNSIKILPKTLCELDISKNNIAILQIENVQKLKHLIKINASHNMISQIQSRMSCLKKVEIILIGNNVQAIRGSDYYSDIQELDSQKFIL